MEKKKRRIVVLFPGWNYSINAARCWDKLYYHLFQTCEKIWVRREYFPGVEAVRNKILGEDVMKGKDNTPFQGKYDYTHILWIDQDVIYTPEDFERLIGYDKDIVAGHYATTDGTLALGAFHPGTNDAITIKKFRTTELTEVAFSGLGFMLMKRGVLEDLTWPWFFYEPQHSENVYIPTHATEDVAFGQRLRKAGYKILVDPKTPVGHEKLVVLNPEPSGVEKFC